SGDSRGALRLGRRELGPPLLERRGLLSAVADAEELSQGLQRVDREELEAVGGANGLAEQLLGLVVAALGGADDPEGHRGRHERGRVLRPDGLARADRKRLSLLDPAAPDEELREAPLRLAQEG